MKLFVLTALPVLISITAMATNALAKPSSTEDFVASSVIVRQILNENLLKTNQYNDTLASALERDSGTQIGGLENCEAASGTFLCSLNVASNGSILKMSISINNGNVVSADIQN